VLQAYRVVKAFSAKQLEREPLHLERFRIGELVFALRSEDGYTVFCRLSEAPTLDGRPSFTISDEDFADLLAPIA
jgi:hypothetical protein